MVYIDFTGEKVYTMNEKMSINGRYDLWLLRNKNNMATPAFPC